MNKTWFTSSPFNAVKSQMSHILKYERNFSQNNEMPPPPPEEEDEDVDQCKGDDMKRCIYDKRHAKEMGLERAPIEFQTFCFFHVWLDPPTDHLLAI